MKRVNIVGRRFGRLKVLSDLPSLRTPGGHSRRWCLCQCDCGEEVSVRVASLLVEHTQSCGCLKSDGARWVSYKHGHGRKNGKTTPTYNSWFSMAQRCYNEKVASYKNYGGRGITVCDRWRGEHGFENFLADMGECPRGKSLDRYPDMNGNYTPENCRWATRVEQANNTRRNVRIYFAGEYMSQAQFCRALNLSDASFDWHYRVTKKPLEQILIGNLCAARLRNDNSL